MPFAFPFHFPPEAHQAAIGVAVIAALAIGSQSLRLLAAALAWLVGGAR